MSAVLYQVWLDTSEVCWSSLYYQGSQEVGKSGKGREFQKCIFQTWKGMEFSARVSKNNEIKNIIVI